MKKIIVFICINLLLLSTVFAQRQKSAISIGPATLSFSLSPGESSTQTVYVHNKLNRPYHFTLEMVDWDLDTNGSDIYMQGGHPNSCAGWIKLDRKTFEVPANSKEGIQVTLTVPDSPGVANNARWTMLRIITTSERKAPRSTTDVNYRVDKSLAVGIRIYQSSNSGITSKEIRMLDFRPVQDSSVYRIESQNTGAAILRCNYSIELSSHETGEKITIGPLEFLVLPGQKRFVDLALPATIPKGKYSAVALIEPGDDDIPLEAAQKEIVIK